jgi:hypothetical protein
LEESYNDNVVNILFSWAVTDKDAMRFLE